MWLKLLRGVCSFKIGEHNLENDKEVSSDQQNVKIIMDGIFIPRKRKRTTMSTMENNMKLQKRTGISVPTQNKYSPLENLNENDDESMDLNENQSCEITDKQQQKNENTPKKATTTKKPPPIVLHGEISDHNQLVKNIKDLIRAKFSIKYHSGFTEIFTTCDSDHQLLKTTWKDTNVPFHSYTTKNEQRRTYILKGLHDKVNREDILRELNELQFPALDINPMRNTKNAIFMVTFPSEIKVNDLNQKVRHLGYTKVLWEHFINKRRLSQCHRCQEWGHVTTNCYADPVCLKCAEQHLTKDCKKPRTEPAKCANCDEPHPANATICKEYRKRLEQFTNRRQKTSNLKEKSKEELERTIPNLDRQNIRNFPPLRKPTSPLNLVSSQPCPLRVSSRSILTAKNLNTETHSSFNNDLNELTILMKEINQIKEMCNIAKMLRAVKELRISLEQCQTPIDKLQSFVNFAENFENYE